LRSELNSFSKSGTIVLGTLAISFYIIHGTYWVLNGVPANLMWACHIGSLAVGFAFIFQVPVMNAIGVLWLGLGNIMWFLYLAGGGEFEITSPLTHIGGITIGIIGIFRMGIPEKSWLWAIISLGILQQMSKWITPEKENINLAFRIHAGWENIFHSYIVYQIVLAVIAAVLFFSLEMIFHKILSKKKIRQ